MRLFALLLALALTGCTSIHQAGTQPYRAAGSDSAINIGGHVELVDGLIVSHRVHITFDGREVITGELDASGTGSLRGMHQGRPIDADCAKIKGAWSSAYNIRCMVFIGNERAANLTF